MPYTKPTINDSLDSVIVKTRELCYAIQKDRTRVTCHFNSYWVYGCSAFRMGQEPTTIWGKQQPASYMSLYAVETRGGRFDSEVDRFITQIITALEEISQSSQELNISATQSTPINASEYRKDDAKKLCIGLYQALIMPTPENCQYLLQLSKTIAGHENVWKKVAMVFSIVAGLLLGLVPGLLCAAYHHRQKTWSESSRHDLADTAKRTHCLIKESISTKRFLFFFSKAKVDERKTEEEFLKNMEPPTPS